MYYPQLITHIYSHRSAIIALSIKVWIGCDIIQSIYSIFILFLLYTYAHGSATKSSPTFLLPGFVCRSFLYLMEHAGSLSPSVQNSRVLITCMEASVECMKERNKIYSYMSCVTYYSMQNLMLMKRMRLFLIFG
jgi:hypothetical protein